MRRALLGLLGTVGTLASPAASQSSTDVPGSEGPLRNDTFLAVAPDAERTLAEGDAAFARSLAEAAAGAARRERTAAFEAWHRALAGTGTGERVGYAPGPGTAPDPGDERGRRLAEGVAEAVLRRLAAIGAPARDEWRRHFEVAAGGALASAERDPGGLARVERLFPATAPALRAALTAGDLAFESGRPAAAGAWWQRAERHATLGAGDAAAALARRRAGLAQVAAPTDDAEVWRTATGLEQEHRVALPGADRRRTRRERPAPGTGVRPGLAFLADGRVLVQTAEDVVLVDPARGRSLATFDAVEVLSGGGLPGLRPGLWSAPGTPGWPLVPAADGDRIVLVIGRAARSRGNVLASVRAPRAGGGPLVSPADALPRLAWAVSGSRWFHGGVEHRPELLAGWDQAEVQPGPVVVGEEVIAQVRERAEDVRAWLAAFDRRTGEPRWRVRLAVGADLVPPRSRVDFGGGAWNHAGQPLTVAGGRVFAGTHLGASALVDAVDGRLVWLWKGRRRDVLDAGWTGARPPASAGGVVAWAPHDSDRLYWLRAAPLGPDGTPLVHPARVLGEAEVLVTADRGGAVVLGRAGRHATLSAWGAEDGSRHDSFYLAAGERITGAAVASESRVLFGTDRAVYLVDRERELYLLDSARFAGGPGHGSSLHARGERVFHLSETELFVFRCGD